MNRCQQIDKWFYTLNEKVHPLIQSEAEDNGTQPLSRAKCKSHSQVKIAILDTGLDLPEASRWNNTDRIIYKSWLSRDEDGVKLEEYNSDCDDGDYDEDGHGTHAGALILKVAPNAILYVARVFRSKNDGKNSSEQDIINGRIAKANTRNLF
jgi:hypothetical protein